MGNHRTIALLEPYCKGSHAAWANSYATQSRHTVNQYTLPGIHWKWRMCHAHLTLAEKISNPPDLLLCSSMLDLASFKGLLPPAWPHLPAALYFHENQLTYPLAPTEKRDLHFAWIQVVSCLAADLVIFNSNFHRDDFLNALPRFLHSFPDFAPHSATCTIAEKSTVVTPGVDTALFTTAAKEHPPHSGPLRILWNHRWETDKEPIIFLTTLLDLAKDNLPYEVILAGAGADQPGKEEENLITQLGNRVIHRGSVPRVSYPQLVAACDLVVSTARHDFYGISIVEAMAAGLMPLLPRHQNYPWLIPEEYHLSCLYDHPHGLLEQLRKQVANPVNTRLMGAKLQFHTKAHDHTQTISTMDQQLGDL